MKCTLQSSKDPMDASLESILPGVHQRLQVTMDAVKANTAAVHANNEKIETLADRIDLGLTKVVDHLDNERASLERKIAAAFLQVTNTELIRDAGICHLCTGRDAPSKPTNNNSFTGTLDDATNFTSTTDGLSPDADMLLITQSPPIGNCSPLSSPGESKLSNYQMSKKLKTLEDMWDEWNGTGRFEDNFGGINGRNKKYGSKRRKHLEVQHYS
jgi:hypothetical protein